MRDEAAIQKRRDALLAADLEKPPQFWWMSFVGSDRPEGERNLGCTVVLAGGFTEALAETWIRGINPGGEVCGTEIDLDGAPDLIAAAAKVAFMLNRL